MVPNLFSAEVSEALRTILRYRNSRLRELMGLILLCSCSIVGCVHRNMYNINNNCGTILFVFHRVGIYC